MESYHPKGFLDASGRTPVLTIPSPGAPAPREDRYSSAQDYLVRAVVEPMGDEGIDVERVMNLAMLVAVPTR